MPTKKKKYNARFPPARIKKIMQKDEEVGKVASTVPVMLSRLLELFTESLILKTNELTLSVNARTLTTSHLKQVILSERKFDFLKDLVAHIPDVQANDEDGGDSNSEQGSRPRQRGRPRKKKEGEVGVPKKRGRKPKAVVPLQEDALEEDNSDDSETEDADSNENEDLDSTSEDATCDRSTETVTAQVRKRRRIDDSATATTSSSCELDSKPRVPVNDTTSRICADHQGSSADLLTVDNSRSGIRETLPSQSNVALPWGLAAKLEVPSVEQMANETCLPLNLKTAGNSSAAVTKGMNPTKSVGHDLETYLLQQQQQELHRAVGLNFGKMSYQSDAGGGGSALHMSSGLGLLAPPPAHQPISQALRHPLASSCLMQAPFARSNMVCPTASEFAPRATLPATRDNTSPSTLSPVVNSSGHAIHRMPVVPASFPGPGAVLARSTSVPHGTGVALKPTSSLVTFPDDDYDS